MPWISRLSPLLSFAGFAAAAATTTTIVAVPLTADASAPGPALPNLAAPHQLPQPPTDSDGDTLKLVQVVFRHGARTPLSKRYWPELVDSWDVCGTLFDPIPIHVVAENGAPCPVNTHNQQQIDTVYKGGCHKGELTLEGQRQARSFGRWLRQRYVISTGYLKEDGYDAVYARSTNYSRTVATLQGVLTGLFPDRPSKPITVRTTEEMDEILFGNPESCQRLKQMLTAARKEIRSTAHRPSAEMKKLEERIRQALGSAAYSASVTSKESMIHFLDLHDAMTSMQTHGKEIPKGMQDKSLLKEIELQATKHFMMFVAPGEESGQRKEMLRLGMGRLMDVMLKRMDMAKRNDGTNNVPVDKREEARALHKIYLYSGHDSSIMPLLAALGKEVDHWPGYLSNLIFELWQKQGSKEHYVRVLYEKEPLNLEEVCGGETCTFQKFKESVLGPYLLTIKEKEKECLVHFSHDMAAGSHVQVE